jgi:hypothetical protein
MAARVKKRADTSTNRESDKIIIRLPAGMRHFLAEQAGRNGRSMNAEVVRALEIYFANEYASQKESQSVATAIKDIRDRLDRLSENLEKADTGELVQLLKQAIAT